LAAGHDDVVSFMLHHFRRVRIDQSNKLGFTALMKSAIQGRTRCAKLLLFAGKEMSDASSRFFSFIRRTKTQDLMCFFVFL